MKRIIIICEGPTEIEFCKDVLYPHFFVKDVFIQTPLIKKSGGGIIPWNNLKKQIENHLIQERDCIISTFIDYYGIKEKFEFPYWDVAHREIDKNRRVSILESGMIEAIDASLVHRFIPYIQLHEFEGLLFNNIEAFVNHIPSNDFVDRAELERVLIQHPNPELINDTPDNAPSYRLKRLIKGYNKIVHGSILAQEIGLPKLRSKSPRFNDWITKLENI